MEPRTHQNEPTEEEIDAAEKLRANGEFAAALKSIQEMLERVNDEDSRMRLLFDVVSCSALLELDDITEQAMKELDTMPQPQFSRVLANMSRAYAEDELGRPDKALAILDMNLETGYFEREDFRIHKYQLCFFKGKALVRLRRVTEALDWLDRAHAMYPSEDSARDESERLIFCWVEPSVQIERANCLLTLDRFEEAFEAAKEVTQSDDSDLATFARQYMAECRLWQSRVPEALELYADLKKRLPCRLVQEDRIERGITNCMNYLEKRRPTSKPS
jgi:tetratricopeptide (TPR) repeat protein